MSHFTKASVVATNKLRAVAQEYVAKLRTRTPSVASRSAACGR